MCLYYNFKGHIGTPACRLGLILQRSVRALVIPLGVKIFAIGVSCVYIKIFKGHIGTPACRLIFILQRSAVH